MVIGIIEGTSGDDTINGTYVDGDAESVTSGNDTINGGASNDRIIVGGGGDSIIGDSGDDSADTILVDEGGGVEYFHMLFDQHEIVFAEGAPSESFHPGEVGMDAIEEAIREEIFILFIKLRVGLHTYG